MDSDKKQRFRRQLLVWYDRHQRDLPWRKDRDPYRVWVSEIMLQQTRVAAVLGKYKEFLARFPNVQALANASLDSVLAAWSGLGYYRRARALHQAAQVIVEDKKGEFPGTAAEWGNLPGIGRYTAAAIASIAFGEAVAVVDGNVERVLGRLEGIDLRGEEVWKHAGDLPSPRRPGDFNQAMMELGATICLPREPKCLLCPVREFCATKGHLPRKEKAMKLRNVTVHYALATRSERVLLKQRSAKSSVMPGMWELPELKNGNGTANWLRLKHGITVTNYDVRVAKATAAEARGGKWIPRAQLREIPLTGLARKILRAADII